MTAQAIMAAMAQAMMISDFFTRASRV